MVLNPFHLFRGLRGKLTLTYTLVTVLALLAIELVVISGGLVVYGNLNGDTDAYLMDTVYLLAPQARAFLQPGKQNITGLQTWLDNVYDSGYASLPSQGLLDSPAAMIEKSDPMYVLSSDGTVLAQTPKNSGSLIGRKYTQPDYFEGGIYTRKPDGNYLVLIPVKQAANQDPLVGTIVVSVRPPPPVIFSFWPALMGWVLATALVMLVGVMPFGTLFGFVMSQGLTRRLAGLTAAADAWSEGNFTFSPQDRSNDEISHLGMRMRHMAERVQALLQARQELAMMEERNRLARELHDTVKQQTFATLMQVRAARNLLTSDPAQAEQHLIEAETLIKTSQQELGRMITELRPAALEGQGLSQALGEYLAAWSQQARILGELQLQNDQPLPLEVEQALFRVAQEALSNVARHSRASAAELRLVFTSTSVCLSINDNGVGFDPSTAAKPGFGLQSMRERVEALGGTFRITSADGPGTTLTATVPLQKALVN